MRGRIERIGQAVMMVSLLASPACRDFTQLPRREHAPVQSPTMEAPPPETPVVAVTPPPVQETPATQLVEVFPHVRADAAAHLVEFDATVPINVHDPEAPLVFLETIVCSPDTKEHESLLVTFARPSHIHAALLLAGLTPGTPGTWKFENGVLVPLPPTGDVVRIEFECLDSAGHRRIIDSPSKWISLADGSPFGLPTDCWVFAGSQMIKRAGGEVYDADGAGTIVGLTTFGSETIALSRVLSPDAAVQEPVWVANKDVPPYGAQVTVRLQGHPAETRVDSPD